MDEASRVILELARAFPDEGREALQALEHFDDQYVQAIQYEVKAQRDEPPKAVLLVDVVGHSEEQAARGVARIRAILERHRNTELVEARDAAEAKRFWADRKKLGAIAARTNAFKLNEDVVLPLDALAEFARFCDAANVAEERHNQAEAIARAEAFLAAAAPAEGGEWLGGHVERARARCQAAREALAVDGDAAVRAHAALHALVQDLKEMLRRSYPALVDGLLAVVEEVRSRRIVLATHMHAGDGNVHVNVPVMSNDRAMMRRAEEIVDRVMERVAALGGVCSGEHGIGVTKLKYLEPGRVAALAAHRAEVDPAGLMNPRKLQDLAILDRIFTPSFNLLELEARILRHGQLEELATRIAKCIRCGKCKPDCCVYHPARGMFFHPRNKNLAIGALVEALLYDAQRERSAGFELLRHLEELADHCTICHKCVKPCPVRIDTGEVSILERRLLSARGHKRTAPATAATLRYLESTSPALNAVFRAGAVRLGGALQRAIAGAIAPQQRAAGGLFASPLPPADPFTLRDVLPRCQPDQALILDPEGEAAATVFYFPGCGSERLHSTVSMAAIHVLLATGTRVVLPPPFLCCGYPHHANAKEEAHGRTQLRASIVFSQLREMLRYLDFDAVVVTCGTCRDALGAMDAARVFGCEVADLARFALGRGLRLAVGGERLYHAPCHDSLDGRAPEVLARLTGARVEPVPHCCSEAGTLALSRPDIAGAMLDRKRAALAEALATRPGEQVVLTNCPSCMQGLGRNAAMGVVPRHVAVELARGISGATWMEAFEAQAARAVAVRF
jgi:Fe-S oxidoreductase